MTDSDPAAIASRLFESYAAGDLDGFRSLLAEDMTGYVTNAGAGVDVVEA